MKARELAAVLREMEKHPRIASIAVGDLRVTFRDAEQPEAVTQVGEPESLELPDGVIDPRKRIEAIYARARAPKPEAS